MSDLDGYLEFLRDEMKKARERRGDEAKEDAAQKLLDYIHKYDYQYDYQYKSYKPKSLHGQKIMGVKPSHAILDEISSFNIEKVAKPRKKLKFSWSFKKS